LRLRIARKTKQKKYWFCCLKDINNVELKNILKSKKNESKIEYIEETFEVLFNNTTIDSLLFVFLFSNTLLTLISDFVVNEIVVVY